MLAEFNGYTNLGGGNSKIFLFSSLFGEDEPILTILFFRWVETTNQLCFTGVFFGGGGKKQGRRIPRQQTVVASNICFMFRHKEKP